jgi:hypothetical protein
LRIEKWAEQESRSLEPRPRSLSIFERELWPSTLRFACFDLTLSYETCLARTWYCQIEKEVTLSTDPNLRTTWWWWYDDDDEMSTPPWSEHWTRLLSFLDSPLTYCYTCYFSSTSLPHLPGAT